MFVCPCCKKRGLPLRAMFTVRWETTECRLCAAKVKLKHQLSDYLFLLYFPLQVVALRFWKLELSILRMPGSLICFLLIAITLYRMDFEVVQAGTSCKAEISNETGG